MGGTWPNFKESGPPRPGAWAYRLTVRPDITRAMRWVWLILFVWLLIGALAAGQRGYYTSASANCSGAGTIGVTILFGPVNYFGANPKLTCS